MNTIDTLAKIQDLSIPCAERIRLAQGINLRHHDWCPALNDASLKLTAQRVADGLEFVEQMVLEDIDYDTIPF